MTIRTNNNSVSQASGCPETQAKLPSHADLIVGPNFSPVSNMCNAQKCLDYKGWVLSKEPYNHSKAIHILLTAATLSKVPAEACNAICAAAFLIKENIFDTNTSAIPEAIAAKLTPLLSNILPDLSPMKIFIDAIATHQANTLSDLKTITSSHSAISDTISSTATTFAAHAAQLFTNVTCLSTAITQISNLSDTPSSADISLLAATTDALGNLIQKQSDIAFKLKAMSMKLSTSLSSTSPIFWPSLYSSAPSCPMAPTLPHTFNANFSPHFAHIQQRLLQATHTILIPYNPADTTIVQHQTPSDLSNLCTKINRAIKNLDDFESALEDTPTRCSIIVSGIQHLTHNTFLLDIVQKICARDQLYTRLPQLW